MNDRGKTKNVLLEELMALRHKVAGLQAECAVLRDQKPGGDLVAALVQAADAVVMYDPELRYTYINQSGASFLGLDSNDVIGKTNKDLVGSGADSIEPFVRKAFEEKERVLVLHEIPLADGVRLFDTIYSPVMDESGAVHSVIGICRDVMADNLRTKKLESLVESRTAELYQANEQLRSEIAQRFEHVSTLEMILA
jgi:PAS domain S-box-containing protein